jgi:formiminoglutamase
VEGRVNAAAHREWLSVHHGNAPLIVSFPHTGTEIPDPIEPNLVSPWLARKDTDFWVDVLYDFAHELGATTIRTALSRTVIDVNRDPSGASLYPGQATTGLCPLETFDGEPLYKSGSEAGPAEFLRRRGEYFDPYHAALAAELERKRAQFGCVVLYDAHSIRSRVPRLFDGELPQFNIGTNNGITSAPDLLTSIEKICDATEFSRVSNGRFRGGWITRHYGNPASGIHAVQMELAMRGYLREPEGTLTRNNWPPPLDDAHAARLRVALRDILDACIHFARSRT